MRVFQNNKGVLLRSCSDFTNQFNQCSCLIKVSTKPKLAGLCSCLGPAVSIAFAVKPIEPRTKTTTKPVNNFFNFDQPLVLFYYSFHLHTPSNIKPFRNHSSFYNVWKSLHINHGTHHNIR